MARRATVFLAVIVITALAVAWPLSGNLGAQEEEPTEIAAEPTVAPTIVPTATPSAYPLRSLTFNLLAQADLSLTTTGPVVVSAATVSIPAGADTLTFVTEGDTVISASTGSVTIEADQGILGVVDVASAIGLDLAEGTPGPIDAVTITTTQQVHLAAGATVTLRNESAAAATLLILTVVQEPAGEP